jgi:hypothetical protein
MSPHAIKTGALGKGAQGLRLLAAKKLRAS